MKAVRIEIKECSNFVEKCTKNSNRKKVCRNFFLWSNPKRRNKFNSKIIQKFKLKNVLKIQIERMFVKTSFFDIIIELVN